MTLRRAHEKVGDDRFAGFKQLNGAITADQRYEGLDPACRDALVVGRPIAG